MEKNQQRNAKRCIESQKIQRENVFLLGTSHTSLPHKAGCLCVFCTFVFSDGFHGKCGCSGCCRAVAPARAGSTSSFIPAWTRKNSSLGKTWGTAAKIHVLGMWVQCGSPARSQRVPGVAFCTAGKGLFGAVTCAWRCRSSQKRVRGCRDHPKDMRAHAWCDPVLYSLNAIC